MKHPSHCWGVCLASAVKEWGALRTQSVSNPVLGEGACHCTATLLEAPYTRPTAPLSLPPEG